MTEKSNSRQVFLVLLDFLGYDQACAVAQTCRHAKTYLLTKWSKTALAKLRELNFQRLAAIKLKCLEDSKDSNTYIYRPRTYWSLITTGPQDLFLMDWKVDQTRDLPFLKECLLLWPNCPQTIGQLNKIFDKKSI